MQKEEFKKRAKAIVEIPAHFKPVIEDILEDENGGGEAIFTWVNEAQEEEEIDLALDLNGHLLRLSIDKNYEEPMINPLNEGEKQRIGESFLGHHYPDALKSLTLSKVINQTYDDIFYYEQLVMDLPLPNAGCTIVIDHGGDVIGFTYQGIKPIPHIPETVIAKEKLVADVQARLDFELNIVQQEEGDFRLVYEPTLECSDYKAERLEPTLTIIHEAEDVYRRFIPLPIPANSPQNPSASNEEIIGITEEMEVIREKDMGDEWGVVWRNKNWEGNEKELSLNAFLANHNDDTVKAFINKETGKVTRFIWFHERTGDLQLTREECFAIASDFLQKMIPEYCPYLQLVVSRESDEDLDQPTTMSGFMFWFHNGQGIPVQSEIVMVVVNPTTGQIDHYSGVHMELEHLQQTEAEPAISKEEARKQFLKHLDFQLSWDYDYENESHTLIYESCDCHTRTHIRYIDAMTGEVITYQDLF